MRIIESPSSMPCWATFAPMITTFFSACRSSGGIDRVADAVRHEGGPLLIDASYQHDHQHGAARRDDLVVLRTRIVEPMHPIGLWPCERVSLRRRLARAGKEAPYVLLGEEVRRGGDRGPNACESIHRLLVACTAPSTC